MYVFSFFSLSLLCIESHRVVEFLFLVPFLLVTAADVAQTSTRTRTLVP